MTPDETVNAFMAHINALDLASATALLSDDCEYDNVPIGKMHGRETVHEFLSPMMSRCSELDWITVRQAATGPLVLNERLDVPVAGIFEVHDGKITLWRDYFDLPTYRDQLPS
jgi:limonene-1,2-epoxide hydrolase